MRLELLAPAGNEEALIAAVQNGADAVYLGGRALGARASASNFFGDVLERSVRYCHLHGVKVYMTVNTLVKESEFADGLNLVREAVQTGVDAYLVQDLGFASVLRQAFPGICLHASTQMSLNNAGGAQMAKTLGFSRVVAARECTLEEISAMAATGMEVEVFGHGALCMGFSGQCLFSSAIGGRSGNRGRCAQPCRLQYTLNDKKCYALSTRDLCTLFDLKTIMNSGACALKLEGRLKRPEYVAVVTSAYRRAIDLALEGKVPEKAELDELLSIFNRGGFTRGTAFKQKDGEALFQERPNHQGVYAGKIVSVQNGRARIKAELPLHDGDGLEARLGDRAVGVSVYGARPAPGGTLQMRVPPETQNGMRLYRTTDAQQLARARKSYEKETRRRPVSIRTELRIGSPALMEIDGISVCGETVQEATGRPLTKEQVGRQLCKLGDTPFACDKADIVLDENAYLPISALNGLRRQGVAALEDDLLQKTLPKVEKKAYNPYVADIEKPQKTLLVHQSRRIEELLHSPADEVYWQAADLREAALKKGLEKLKSRQGAYLYLPQYLTENDLDAVERALADWPELGVVANNLSQIGRFAHRRLVAGEGINVFNPLSAAGAEDFGAERVVLSTELNQYQALSCARKARCEWIVYGRQTLMCMRNCPLRAQKGLGASGREKCALCGGEGYTLTDRMGEKLQVLPYKTQDGCTLLLQSAQVLNLVPRLGPDALSAAAAIRVIGSPKDVEYVRRCLAGEEIDPPEGTNYTLGAFARGVE